MSEPFKDLGYSYKANDEEKCFDINMNVEEKKYKAIWDKLDKETKLRINNDAAEIIKNRPYPKSIITLRAVKFELMDLILKEKEL